MKGLELSEKYFEEYGREMLEKDFSDILPSLCVGLVGAGSECFGFDDDVSKDHDFEPGFCIFIPGEDEIGRRRAFELERAYAKLPKEFMGFKRSNLSPAGGNRHGVISIPDFYSSKVGKPDGNLTITDWFTLPEFYLAEATNGRVFFDNLGLFTRIRENLSTMPEDVRLKKLAGKLIMMNQAGKYNYERCLDHGETGAAQLALFEFAKNAMHAAFLLNRKYMPFYKWCFRAMRELPALGELADPLEYLISNENDKNTAKTKSEIVYDISLAVIEKIKNDALSDAVCDDLEKHAFSVNDRISDPSVRNTDILAGA